ncbi:hypothetical protein D6T64_20090 [Cryobacterium melibiosiphilum]|uniref:Uncharacterized protein n=1 Tax=Cryobacterium melibiosiphilum TaxID=995039 RepID=A0A3A5MHB8_9MICO|nr:hypothetical protein [Cryobacterium melibiosiphilum]RJT85221.1 hypothetical protein D6T64_20090 [Cryobacterium melibiosiphilum]
MAGTRGRAARAVLAVAVTALLALTIGVPSATAAPIDLTLSTDGVTFSETLPGGLFDDLGLLIPRGSQSATLWVKNPTDSAASLRISTRDLVVSDPVFAGVVSLATWNSATGAAATTTLAAADGCRTLVSTGSLAAGETVRIVVTFTMADATGLTGQNGWATLNFLVTMRQDAAGVRPESACDDGGVLVPVVAPTAEGVADPGHRPVLPLTGVPQALPLLVLAALFVGAGVIARVAHDIRGAAECARLGTGRNHGGHPLGHTRSR